MDHTGVRLLRGRRECILPGLLCADVFVLCDESEDLKGMVEHFVEVCSLKLMQIRAR